MKKAFNQIPEPLQRQILYRLGGAGAVLLVSVALLLLIPDFYSIISCIVVMIFCIISSFLLFRKAVMGEYVIISGECLDVALTALKRRTKMITLRTEDNQKIQVMIKQRLKKIYTGSHITLYVASNMPVYENGGSHILYSYLALEMNQNK